MEDLATRQKRKFRGLIRELLKDCSSKELAERLRLTASTIRTWLTEDERISVDKLPLSTLLGISNAKGCTIDELVSLLELQPSTEDLLPLKPTYQQEKFRNLIKELSLGINQKDLAKIFNVSKGTISNWINAPVEPQNMPGSVFITIAYLKGWTIEELMIYLGLKSQKMPLASLSMIQEIASSLSVKEQGQLIAWLMQQVNEVLEARS